MRTLFKLVASLAFKLEMLDHNFAPDYGNHYFRQFCLYGNLARASIEADDETNTSQKGEIDDLEAEIETISQKISGELTKPESETV